MLNKSGGFALNRHVAARQDAMAGKTEESIELPDAKQEDGEEPHSFELHKTNDGYHSMTHHADGHMEHQDHASYEDAKSHMDSKFAGSGDQESDGDGSEMNESGEDNETAC